MQIQMWQGCWNCQTGDLKQRALVDKTDSIRKQRKQRDENSKKQPKRNAWFRNTYKNEEHLIRMDTAEEIISELDKI